MKKLSLSLLILVAVAGLAHADSGAKKIAVKSFLGALDKVNSQTGSFSTLSAATGISYFQVYAVASPSVGGWEGVSASQTSTSLNHGGGYIDVAVLQYGYGNETGGRLGGSAGVHYATENLCGAINNLHYCSVGETITGWMYYYEFSGATGGLFDASAYSTASPFGNWTDSIYIQ